MEHEIHVVDRPGLRVLAKRQPVMLDEIGPALERAFDEAYGAIQAARATPEGPPFVIYHSMPETGRPLDIEICAPVNGTLDASAPWHVASLPPGTFASRKHTGPYDSVGATYDALTTWIPAHGYVVAGPPREVYLSEPGTPPQDIETIVEFPVLRVPAPVG